jgi:CRP-like cAMP-binding protein
MAELGISKWLAASYREEEPFLDQIPREARDYFILKSHLREFDKDDLIFNRDSEGEFFYVLQTGKLQVCGEKVDGRYTEIAILGRGACFGEMSIMTGDRTSNTIIALEDSTVFAMSREDFTHFVTQSPEILILLYKILAERLRNRNRQTDAFLQSPLMGHFHSLSFIDIAQSFEKEQKSGTLHISHENEEGFMAFHKGQLYFARTSQQSGPDALEAMLLWTDAWFRFDTHHLPEEKNISGGGTTGLILDALRNIDEKGAH